MSVKHQLARRQLMDLSKALVDKNMVYGNENIVSLKMVDEGIYAITCINNGLKEVKQDGIPLIDKNGNIINGDDPLPKKWINHIEIYNENPEINSIIEINSPNIAAFVGARKSIPAVFENFKLIVGGEVKVCNYLEGDEARGNETLMAKSIVNNLKNRKAVIIPNRSLIAIGESIEEAYEVAIICEKSAKATLLAELIGGVIEI